MHFILIFSLYTFFLITGKAEEPEIVWNLTPADHLGPKISESLYE